MSLNFSSMRLKYMTNTQHIFSHDINYQDVFYFTSTFSNDLEDLNGDAFNSACFEQCNSLLDDDFPLLRMSTDIPTI